MKRKKTLLMDTIGQFGLFPLIGKLLPLLSLGMVLITGCDLDRDRDAEPPVIEKLTVTSPINVQAPIDVAAVVLLNEEDLDLSYEYEWSATGGQITNNGVLDADRMSATTTDSKNKTNGAKRGYGDPSVTAIATYIAPKTPGIYTITLKVCTRYAVVEKSTPVEVTDFIIESSPRVHWKSTGGEQIFIFSFDVDAIRRAPILLRYEIEPAIYVLEADFYISIGGKRVQPVLAAQGLIPNEIDITKHIKCPERHELIFTLKPKEEISRSGKNWSLKNIKIVGVEGNFLP